MKSKIKFIYFDLGGVFFNRDNYFGNVAREFNLERKQFAQMFTKYNKEITKGRISSQEFWEKCKKELNIKDGKDFNFVENWVGDYVAIEKMHQFAKDVSKKYEIGILSNIYEGMYPLMILQKKIPNISFKVKILSCDEGLMKPESGIYKFAQKRLAIKLLRYYLLMM